MSVADIIFVIAFPLVSLILIIFCFFYSSYLSYVRKKYLDTLDDVTKSKILTYHNLDSLSGFFKYLFKRKRGDDDVKKG